MSSAHEIVTIQTGNYANFIGAHWWNIQESSFCFSTDSSVQLDINHDVLFREGLNLRGEVTYTPRLVLVDLEDSLTSIRRECALYRTSETDKCETLWDGPVDVIKEDPVRLNPFLEELETLERSQNNVDSTQSDTAYKASGDASAEQFDFNSPSTIWSDFLKTSLHPKSFCLFQDSNSLGEKSPLDLYSYGEEMYIKNGRDQIEESIRRMSEECDYLQGFHVLFDAHNCFSGVSSQILQHLDDEFKRRPSLCFPVYQDKKHLPIQDIGEQMNRLYASLVSMSAMNSYCSFFTPLSLSDDIVKLSQPFKKFPFLQYDETLMYQTSAILAAAIETLTSPYRLRSKKFSIADITSVLSTYGRKLVCSSVCLPFPLEYEGYLNAMVEKDLPEYYMTSLSPYYKPNSEKTLFQCAVLRGVPANKFQNPKKFFYNVEPEEIFGQYLNKFSSSSVTTATVFQEKCSVDAPFPNIFESAVSESGFLNPTANSQHNVVNKVPVAASFNSSDSAGEFIDDLLSQASKLNFKEYVKCTETTYERDNFLEVVENLRGLQDNFQHYS